MASYAYVCLHQLNIRPSVFMEMSIKERAFIIASIQIKAEHHKKAEKEAERKTKRGR